MRFLLTLVSAILVLASASAQEPPESVQPPTVRVPLGVVQASYDLFPQSEFLIDADDFYLDSDGKEIRLKRAVNEVAVKFASSRTKERALAELSSVPGVPSLKSLAQAKFGRKPAIDILSTVQPGATLNVRSIRSSSAVDWAYPVLVDPESNCRMIPTDEVLVRLADGVSPDDVRSVLEAAGVTVVERTGPEQLNVYLVRLIDPKAGDALTASRRLAADNKVIWAEPNFIRQVRFSLVPNDPMFGYQQNLNNQGQNGAVADSDVDAPEAWDVRTGSSSIVIAIIDDGVDTSHPDLVIAPGGWDFANGDSNPSPVGTNGHGTACAGVAAAVGNNTYRVAGTAYGCKILPIKIIDDSGVFATSQVIGNAITYAADRADILSNSWGGGSPSSYINNAISYANTNGRGGKGCPVFFASGNAASTWYRGGARFLLSTAGLNGSYYLGFCYVRGQTSAGEECVRIDNVCLLDCNGYTHKTSVLPRQDFEGSFPPSGWWLARGGGATADWYKSTTNALTGTGGSWSARSPSLSNGQYAWLFTPLISITGCETLAFAASISMSTKSSFYVDVYDSSMRYIGSWGPLGSGVPAVQTSVSYPANLSTTYPNVCAVGASTDCDFRSAYSQYGDALDFVAPSNGGWNDVPTLDPTGSVGWTSTDYMLNFGGTSAACPLAAGVAALVLSKNPTLTASQVRTILRDSCDKIGGVSYQNGRNQYYGYGRINARTALDLTPELCVPPSITQHPQSQTRSVGQRAEFCVTATGTQPLNYQWRKNGTPISGATDPCFAIDPVGTCDAGNYDCVVTNSCGSVTSNQATLTISSTPIQSAAAAKMLANGTTVTLTGPVVTRAFGNFFYVEDANRASGIRVNLCPGTVAPNEGDKPVILGVLDTILGERVIRDALLTPAGSGTIPKPIGMNNASANRATPVGLLVTVWGKVTVPPGATNRFRLNDGSKSGVEVVLYGVPLPENGSFLKVRGALGWEGTKPVIHVNSQNDLW